MKRFTAAVLVTAMSIFAALPLHAWGEKGHYIVNEAATLALPTDMPSFFYRAFPQLVWEAYDPDRWKGAGQSLDAENPPDHFLDYEFVNALELPPDRYKFIDLLYRSGTLRRYGVANSTIGFLPWRIAELCDRLTNEWRQWRLSQPGSPERRDIEADIIHDAGILGHFVGDASNPDHATINFNGWIDDNPNHYPNDCDAHARFEQAFVSHALTTSDATPFVRPAAVLRTDYFGAAMEEIRASNREVETLYRIDRDHGFDIFRPPTREAVEFTARRLAAGSSMLRDLWWSTWKNSEKPPKHRAPATVD